MLACATLADASNRTFEVVVVARCVVLMAAEAENGPGQRIW